MKIFVSYSRKSKAHAKELIQNLKKLGHEVSYDEDIVGGDKWWAKILDYIRNCQVFVFAHSESAGFSEACIFELDYAQKLNRPIIPVILEGEKSEKKIPTNISELQYIDYRKKDSDSILDLYAALKEARPDVPLPNPLPKPPQTPRLSHSAEVPDNSLTFPGKSNKLVPTPPPSINYTPFLWVFICMYLGLYGWLSIGVNESERLAAASSAHSQPVIIDGISYRNMAQAKHQIRVDNLNNFFPRIDKASDFLATIMLAFFCGAAGRTMRTGRQNLIRRQREIDRPIILAICSGGIVGLVLLGISYLVIILWNTDWYSIKTLIGVTCLIGGFFAENILSPISRKL